MPRNVYTQRRVRLAYQTMITAAKQCFIEELRTYPSLPLINLTEIQYYSMAWRPPPAYQDLVVRVNALMVVHHQYELAPAQMMYAFFEALRELQKVLVNDVPIAQIESLSSTDESPGAHHA